MLTKEIITGLLIPFIGTSAGGACVFFMKRGLNIQLQKALSGFAGGVMVAASKCRAGSCGILHTTPKRVLQRYDIIESIQ